MFQNLKETGKVFHDADYWIEVGHVPLALLQGSHPRTPVWAGQRAYAKKLKFCLSLLAENGSIKARGPWT